jgi:hypothetical protein
MPTSLFRHSCQNSDKLRLPLPPAPPKQPELFFLIPRSVLDRSYNCPARTHICRDIIGICMKIAQIPSLTESGANGYDSIPDTTAV